MDPKRKTPETDDSEVLDLTLTQDIETLFDDEDDADAVDESFQQEDFETL